MLKSALFSAAATFVATMVAAGATVLPKPMTDADYHWDGAPSPALVELGRNLFFDPILSGNRNISCGTCHDPNLGTGDGLALGIGEGGAGAGKNRHTRDGVTGRVPRNAQPLYNIGAKSYVRMFHDGRLEPDPTQTFPSGFWSPAREHLPAGLPNILTAQAMFPVLSPVEMAGQKGENPVATAVAEDRVTDAWAILAKRLNDNAEYRAMFKASFGSGKIDFAKAAEALAAFQTVAFRSEGSPFQQALRTADFSALSDAAQRGLKLFYGTAGCAACHSGPLLTDHKFRAIAMPQIGPGKGHGRDTEFWRTSGFMTRLEDEGRYRVTFDPEDLFRFRTPSLLNVALTGPWGHSGAFDRLEDVVRHHANPVRALHSYETPVLPPLEKIIEQTGKGSALMFRPLNPARRATFDARDSFVQTSTLLRHRIAGANDLAPQSLTDTDVADIVAFLDSLTDPAMQKLSTLVPEHVPSGLSPQPIRTRSNADADAD